MSTQQKLDRNKKLGNGVTFKQRRLVLRAKNRELYMQHWRNPLIGILQILQNYVTVTISSVTNGPGEAGAPKPRAASNLKSSGVDSRARSLRTHPEHVSG